MPFPPALPPQACWINDPESKGKVESQVKYVRRGFFYGRKFKDLDHLNHEVLIWCNNEANPPRVHGTTHEIPWDRLATEKHHLKPLLPITMPYIMGERRATRTSMISVEGNAVLHTGAFCQP